MALAAEAHAPGSGGYSRSWRRLQKLAVKDGVRPLRFHDSRHTFASWALESGKSIKWVQDRLGHSSPELTLRTYAHLMPSDGGEMGWLDPASEKNDLKSKNIP